MQLAKYNDDRILIDKQQTKDDRRANLKLELPGTKEVVCDSTSANSSSNQASNSFISSQEQKYVSSSQKEGKGA